MALRMPRTVAFVWGALVFACGTEAVGEADGGSADGGLADAAPPPPDGSDADAGADSGASRCDDGDPCTTDSEVGDGGCRHSVAPDGTPCSDGARCTGQDRCVGGVCRGTELAPHVQARGHLIGFGAAANEDDQPINGLGDFVADDRLLFVDRIGSAGSALSLVRITPAGLERLDTQKVSLSLGWDQTHQSNFWASRPTTFLVPLGNQRAAVVASQQRIEIFDTSSGTIVSTGLLAFPPPAETIVAATGGGPRLYTCQKNGATGQVDAWEIDAASVIHHRSAILLPNTSGLGNECSSLAVTADGRELVVATREGIDRINVTDPNAMALKTRFAPNASFLRVALSGDFIVAQRPAASDRTRDIQMYRRSDLEANPQALPVTTFAASPGNALPAKWPLGFAFLDDAIAIEWKLKNNATSIGYVTEIHNLPGGAPRKVELSHRVEDEDRLRTRPFVLAGRGRHLIVPPWRTVLRDDPVGNKVTTLAGPEASGFESLVPGAAEHMTALSALGVHDINLQNPDAPKVTGSALPADASFFRWQPGGSHRLAAPIGARLASITTVGALTLMQDVTPVSCFTSSSGAIAPSGSVKISEAFDLFNPGQVHDLGRALLHVNPLDLHTGVRLRWYDAPPACDGRTLAPSIDGTVAVNQDNLWFGVGGTRSGPPAIVLADVPGMIDPTLKMTIQWLEQDPGKTTWRTAATAEFDTLLEYAHHIEVHKDLAVIHDGRRMVVVRRNGSTIDLVAQREIRDGADFEDISEILHFDGELIYASTKKAPTGVVVLRPRDLERVARFTTHGLARSMAEVSGRVVFGSANAIDVVDAICPP
jgi:hypothetical protein